jgi:hypothetical protein
MLRVHASERRKGIDIKEKGIQEIIAEARGLSFAKAVAA